MKKNRQEAIIELIQQYPIETQEELLSRLNQIGFKTTQATISRDIRELALIKKPDADGKQIYCLIDQEDETSRKYQRILSRSDHFHGTSREYAGCKNRIGNGNGVCCCT